MSAKNDWLNWCLGMSQQEEEEFHNNDELHNTYFPEYVSHIPIITQDSVYDEEERNCTEDIGDDN